MDAGEDSVTKVRNLAIFLKKVQDQGATDHHLAETIVWPNGSDSIFKEFAMRPKHPNKNDTQELAVDKFDFKKG